MILKTRKLRPDAVVPRRMYAHDAGLDLCWCPEGGTVPPTGLWSEFPTGLAMEIPQGYFLLVKERSGLARRYGTKVLGGVIDAGYRGEIIVMLAVPTKETWETMALKPGDRIAQALLLPVVGVEVEEVEALSGSERGAGGFGSSGR
jgi:dUTP pyrophosphatase